VYPVEVILPTEELRERSGPGLYGSGPMVAAYECCCLHRERLRTKGTVLIRCAQCGTVYEVWPVKCWPEYKEDLCKSILQ